MLAIRNRNDIDIQNLLLNIGYGDGCQPSARIESLIDDYVENVYHLIRMLSGILCWFRGIVLSSMVR